MKALRRELDTTRKLKDDQLMGLQQQCSDLKHKLRMLAEQGEAQVRGLAACRPEASVYCLVLLIGLQASSACCVSCMYSI